MNIEHKIRTFLESIIDEKDLLAEICNDDSLIDMDIMDSLAILYLMSFLDEEFDIIPSDDEIYPENFETINAIDQYIQNKGNHK